MTADAGLYFFQGNTPCLDDDLVVHHNRRRNRQIQLKPGIGLVFVPGFCNNLNGNIIFSTQPGHYFEKMASGLAIGFVEEKT